MCKEANTTRDIRERKNDNRIKGKREGGKQIGKDVRRSMTVKLQKELVERTRNRDSSNTTEAPPEAQAVEQTEESAVNLVGGIKERTGDGFSKVIHGKQAKREKQSPHQRPAPATGDAVPPGEDAAQPPASPQERMKRKAAGDMRTRRAEAGRTPQAPKERPAPEIAHERPKPNNPIKERGTTTAPVKERSETAAPPTPKERMRQTAIKDKQTQRAEIREKPHTPREREQAAPLHERTNASTAAPVNTATQPTAQERMRQKAVADLREKRIEEKRELAAPRMEPRTASAPPPVHISESNGVSPDNQSINPSIRERPRRAAKPKEKPAGGAFTPKTRQSAAKIPGRKAAPTAAKGKTATQQAARAKLRVQRNAQRKLLQQSTQRTAKRAADLSRRAAIAIVKAVSSAISAIAGLAGGAVLIPVIIVIILIGAIMASPFGILFSNEPTPDATPLNIAVGHLNMELSNSLELMQTGDYDNIDVQGQGPDWREVVAVFAAKTAGAADGVDVAALTPDRVDRLKAVFWDMCIITSEVETIDHPDSNPDDDTDDSWTETNLTITITAKTAEEMRTQYAFTDDQNEALTELLAELATMEILLTDLSVSEEQARELLRNLPDDLAPERRAVIEAACQLVGKVTYFWGGKSLVIGWDSRWGQVQKVWADGSSTTGTYRPYGLDCSGFVDWAFYNATDGGYIIGHGGGAAMQHTYCTPITWAEAIPGDLVFYPEDSHVGIVGGRDEAGNLVIVHCASGYNCVVVTSADGFTSIGRPLYYAE